MAVALLLSFGICFEASSQAGNAVGAEDYYPIEGFRTASPESQGLDSDMLYKMLSHVQSQRYDLHGLVVIRNGYKILDVGFFPHGNDYKHVIHSCTKSFTSALVGISIDKGELPGIESKALDFFPSRQFKNPSPNKEDISVKDLLMMASGIEWSESGNYDSLDLTVRMLNSEDPIGFFLDRPGSDAPGAKFSYSSGGSHLLSAILQTSTGRTASDLAAASIFEPLGIVDWYWRKDRAGFAIGAGELYLKPEDMAKFGYLYLRRGRWEGRQIVTELWVEESTRKQIDTPAGPGGRHGYGYQWWMNPFGGYSARGRNGQYIFVVPRHDLVVVATAGLVGGDFFMPESLVGSFIIPAIKAEGPRPENKEAYERLSELVEKIGRAPAAAESGELPAIARRISGRTYAMEDKEALSLSFDGSDECALSIVAESWKETLKIGLDDRWRVNEGLPDGPLPGDNAVACKGRWIDDSTFVWRWKSLNENVVALLQYKFQDDALEVSGSASWGSWTIKGRAK